MKIEWKFCFRIGASIFLLYLCLFYWKSAARLLSALVSAAAPLLLGCVIAYLINILMTFYESRYFVPSKSKIAAKSRRPVCMAGAFVTLLALLTLLLRLVIPQLISCFELLFSVMPGAMEDLVDWVGKLEILPEDIEKALSAIDWQSKAGEIIKTLTSGIGDVMNVVLSTLFSVFSGIITTLMAVIFSIYLLADKEKLRGQLDRLLKRYIKKQWYDKLMHVLVVMNDCFHHYIVGQCTEALILGLLCMIGMAFLRLPYGAMIGTLVGFTALIPVAGAYIGAWVGAFMIFTVSPVKALIFLIFLGILQQLEGNLIYPRVVGSSMGLPAIWVLAAVTIGGGMLGIPGMLLGVPVAATVYRLLKENVNKPRLK